VDMFLHRQLVWICSCTGNWCGYVPAQAIGVDMFLHRQSNRTILTEAVSLR